MLGAGNAIRLVVVVGIYCLFVLLFVVVFSLSLLQVL